MNIYVANLSWSTNRDSLCELFSRYGDVASANIILDKMTGRSRGFGFVEIPDEVDAKRAIEELNGAEFEGKTITVNVARPREEKPYNNDRRRY